MDVFIQKILKNIQIDTTEAFDRNFERKAFFSAPPWKPTQRPVSRGSLLVRTSRMRNSIQSKVVDSRIEFSSSKPQTGIHNEGGEINRVSKKGKAYTIKMPERRFIGHAPQIDQVIEENIDNVMPGVMNELLTKHF